VSEFIHQGLAIHLTHGTTHIIQVFPPSADPLFTTLCQT